MAHLKTDTSANSHFASVPGISRSRNAFSISEKHVTTIKFDYLFPLWHKFIYPGDTLAITMQQMARLQTQIAVLFDDLYIDAHAWFVPMRLIQTNWARYQFNTQTTGPAQDNSSLTSPSIDLSALGAGGFVAKTLYDYLGYPTEVNLTASTAHINNYLARAYNAIYNASYRDENLQNPVPLDLDDGPDVVTDYVLLKRGKRHDKFTSALTATQKGTAPTIGLLGSANVYGAGSVNATTNAQVFQYWNSTDAATQFGDLKRDTSNQIVVDNGWSGTDAGDNTVKLSLGTAAQYASMGSAYAPPFADLSTATGTTWNVLRSSLAVQHLLEADARGGTRDVESIQHRWGVTVPDFRLQRPEYIGGATWSFDGHIVPQTSESGTTPQATLKQFSQSLNKLSLSHSFVEHGIFMILVSCRSNITYQQGLNRELSYRTRYDWYQPEFANLGEVAILNKEILLGPTDAANNGVFGHNEYGYWLRYGENRVSAEMRSNYATSLDSRHMADDYGTTLPTLNAAWIVSNTPIDRNIAVATATADPIQINQLVTGKIARTLPMFSIPGLLRL